MISKKLSDLQLYQLCQNYGAQALKWRWKFAGLLPEVSKRKLFEKKGYSSIFEFAAKLAGMSKEQVSRILNLEKRFADTPVLKAALETGEVSPNKLARVASIATPENQEVLANQVQILSNRGIETLVKDEKLILQNNGQKTLFEEKSVHVHTLQLDEDVRTELEELQAKGIKINQIIRQALQKRQQEIVEEKEELAKLHGEKLSKKDNIQKHPSRYIPVRIKRLIQAEQGTKCSIPLCYKPAEQLHHTQRFALSQSHDPRYLAQLCKEHHQIAHSIDVRVCEVRKTRWR